MLFLMIFDGSFPYELNDDSPWLDGSRKENRFIEAIKNFWYRLFNK